MDHNGCDHQMICVALLPAGSLVCFLVQGKSIRAKWWRLCRVSGSQAMSHELWGAFLGWPRLAQLPVITSTHHEGRPMKHTSPDISCTDILALSTFFCWTSSCPDSCDVMRAECALWPAPVPIIASAHSAQLPAPMTSDHWLPVLDSPQLPDPASPSSSSMVIINIHYDPASDDYSHAATRGASFKAAQ